MLKRYKVYLIWGLVLIMVLFGSLGANALGASARGYHQNAAQAGHTDSPGKSASVKTAAPHTVNMQDVPGEKHPPASTHSRDLSFQTGVSPAVYAQRKAAAAHYKNGARVFNPYSLP